MLLPGARPLPGTRGAWAQIRATGPIPQLGSAFLRSVTVGVPSPGGPRAKPCTLPADLPGSGANEQRRQPPSEAAAEVRNHSFGQPGGEQRGAPRRGGRPRGQLPPAWDERLGFGSTSVRGAARRQHSSRVREAPVQMATAPHPVRRPRVQPRRAESRTAPVSDTRAASTTFRAALRLE